MKVTQVRNCHVCHECGEPLEISGEDGEEEWCGKCGQLKYYRSHGFSGFGDEPEDCPYVDVEFDNRGGGITQARSREDGRGVLYERHQPLPPLPV